MLAMEEESLRVGCSGVAAKCSEWSQSIGILITNLSRVDSVSVSFQEELRELREIRERLTALAIRVSIRSQGR